MLVVHNSFRGIISPPIHLHINLIDLSAGSKFSRFRSAGFTPDLGLPVSPRPAIMLLGSLGDLPGKKESPQITSAR